MNEIVLLKILCGEDDALEADDIAVNQPVRHDLVPVWLAHLERNGCYDRTGKHWKWSQMMIYPHDAEGQVVSVRET